METVNSKDKKLESGEIIVMALHQIGTGDMPMATALAIIAREGTLETADTTQIGNTVFLAHRGTGDNKNKMVGRAFNVDTARNFIDNCLDYMEYLREKGITHYTTIFEGSEVLKLMQFLQRFLESTDTNIYIGEDANNKYIAYVKLGNDPIPEVT